MKKGISLVVMAIAIIAVLVACANIFLHFLPETAASLVHLIIAVCNTIMIIIVTRQNRKSSSHISDDPDNSKSQ